MILFQLHLTRQIGYHIVQTYIPSSVFVVSKIYVLDRKKHSVPVFLNVYGAQESIPGIRQPM
jgi:hypothetical protein